MNPTAARIQKLIDDKGINLKQLCDAAGVNYYAVYPWWQREHSKPTWPNVQRIADAIGVSPVFLMTGDDSQQDIASRIAQKIQSLSDDDRKSAENYLDWLIDRQSSDQ